MTKYIDPKRFVITRRRKLYKFALFHNSPLCFELDEWDKTIRPDVLEIGAGTGLFSVGLAQKYPAKQFVAIDVKADRLQTGARQADVDKLSNIYFLRARADQLAELFRAGSIGTIWLTFPDPYPKKRSAGRRLTQPHFLKIYQQLLRSDGALCLKTDAVDLFEWSLEQFIQENWLIKQQTPDLHNSNLSDDYKITTTYEKRFIADGLPTKFVKARPPRVQ